MTSKPIPPDSPDNPSRLADALREGSIPLIIRRKGAQGELTASLPEKIEILTILAQDPEEAIRQQALSTLENWNPEELCGILEDAACPYPVLEFAAQYLVEKHPQVLEALLQNITLSPVLQDQILSQIEVHAGELASGESPDVEQEDESEAPGNDLPSEEPHARETTLQRISRMTPVQKIKCALTGNQEERLILIREANKMVARAVLQSPKLSEAEIEAYAAMRNVSEEVLRMIATNRAFVKSYTVLRALVNNPRAPLDVTLPMIGRLNDRDMKGLATNKNIPDALRSTAAKTLNARHTTRNISFSRKH